MSHTLPSRLTVAAIAASIASLGLTGVADAATHAHAKKHARKSSRAHRSSAKQSNGTTTAPSDRQNPHETPLTGDALAKATAAALVAVPGGTVVRAETQDPSDPDGGVYEVHMRASDGSDVTVLEDASFTVTKVQQDRGGRGDGQRPGRGCHGDADGDGPAAGGDAPTGDGSGASTPVAGTTPVAG